MYALIDCNNFYASCERLFRPELRGKPVVVLSNNDGCVVSRSDEAKAAGVAMAVPYHEIRDLARSAGIHVFSSNYALYGDLSARVVDVLREHAPRLETYSIDESFADVSDIPDLRAWGMRVREAVLRDTGLPVCVGICRTRTLAKAANHVAKKFKDRTAGVHVMDSPALEEKALRWIPVGDVWGVGRASARKLQARGVRTGWDFARLPQAWVRATLGVVGARTWQELNGTPCGDLSEMEPDRRSVRTSRSFASPLTDSVAIEQAIATFAGMVAAKLRTQGLAAAGLGVYLRTGSTGSASSSGAYRGGGFPVATSDTREVVALALRLLRSMPRPGPVKKAGVDAFGLVPEGVVQGNMFDTVDREGNARLQGALDGLEKRWGKDAVKLAVQGTRPGWRTRREHLSRRYTTAWSEILEIDMDRTAGARPV